MGHDSSTLNMSGPDCSVLLPFEPAQQQGCHTEQGHVVLQPKRILRGYHGMLG